MGAIGQVTNRKLTKFLKTLYRCKFQIPCKIADSFLVIVHPTTIHVSSGDPVINEDEFIKLSVRVEKNVGRLDVTMHKAQIMHFLQTSRYLDGHGAHKVEVLSLTHCWSLAIRQTAGCITTHLLEVLYTLAIQRKDEVRFGFRVLSKIKSFWKPYINQYNPDPYRNAQDTFY